MDSERVDTGRSRLRAVALVLFIGLVVGGALGALVGSSRPPSYQAETALSVLPDSVALNSQGNGTDPTLDPTAYIQGQLVTLNGEQVLGAARTALKLRTDPDVSSTQIGQTYVVQITATASSRAAALEAARTTATVYTALRVDRLTAAINDQIKTTQTRLTSVQKTLAQLQARDRPNAAATPTETALQNETQRLLSLTGTLSLQLAQVDNVVSVEAPAHVVSSGVSGTVVATGIGALGGAVLALVALLLYRRISPRTSTVGDVVELGVPVLLPVLPRTGGRSAAPLGRTHAVRLIAARLASQERQRVLVVFGATHRVGTSRTAASLAAAIAARGPVLLVLADGSGGTAPLRAEATGLVPSTIPGVWLLPGAHDLIGAGEDNYPGRSAALVDVLRRAVDAGWYVVVDAPPLSETDIALDCLRVPSSTATLVVGRGTSRPADVLSAAELFDVRGGGFAGAILNDLPRVRLRRTGTGVQVATAPSGEPEPTIASTPYDAVPDEAMDPDEFGYPQLDVEPSGRHR